MGKGTRTKMGVGVGFTTEVDSMAMAAVGRVVVLATMMTTTMMATAGVGKVWVEAS